MVSSGICGCVDIYDYDIEVKGDDKMSFETWLCEHMNTKYPRIALLRFGFFIIFSMGFIFSLQHLIHNGINATDIITMGASLYGAFHLTPNMLKDIEAGEY